MRPESQQYFYHPDHLGSGSFISDASGEACQFLAYLPFGEQWVDQRSSCSYDAPYKFSGKELDAETGYNYFGARYYDSGLSVWLSVDPMADKYPSLSSYCFVANNPITISDPDGMRLRLLGLRLFHKREYSFVTQMLCTEEGNRLFAPYMSRQQARKFIGKESNRGQFSREVSIKFNSRRYISERSETGGMSAKFNRANSFRSEEIDDFIDNYSGESTRMQITITLMVNSESDGAAIQTLCHEVGLHVAPLLLAHQEILTNPDMLAVEKANSFAERWDDLYLDPDRSLSGYIQHVFHWGLEEDSRRSKVYSNLANEYKHILQGSTLQQFLESEKDDTSY